jgi:hypothetical protein
MTKLCVCLVGIAGNDKDILLSNYVLKSYLMQFKAIRDAFTIVILDYNAYVSSEQVRHDIENVKPDFIGFSCYVWNWERIEYLLPYYIHTIPVIVGGPQVTKPAGDDDTIRYVVGDGEEAMYRWLLGKAAPIQLLSERPKTEVDWSSFERASFETQRGCNWRCAYCNYRKGNEKISYRNPEVVVKEIKGAWQHGIKLGRIVDPNFMSDAVHFSKIMNGLIANGIKMRLFFEVIPALVTESMANVCRVYIESGGELVISLGIQSINRESLKAINRPHGGEDTAIDLLSAAGATLRLDSILGLPYETVTSYEAMIDWLCQRLAGTRHYPNPNLLMIIDGTPLAGKVKQFGLKFRHDYVYDTPHMNAWDINWCMKLNAVLYRIYGPNSKIRDNFKEMNLHKLKQIVYNIDGKLPKVVTEEYYYEQINDDITDEMICQAH